MSVRSAAELVGTADPVWPLLLRLIEESPVQARVLDVSRAQGIEVLHRLQMPATSVLGAFALHCGGVLVDDGWLRLLGGGGRGVPDLATANGVHEPATVPPDAVVIGYDVLGGRFAVDGGGLGADPGEVCYWGPDTLAWAGIGGRHRDFLEWAFGGGLAEFYRDLRWPTWRRDVRLVPPDRGLSAYPPPFTAEGSSVGNPAGGGSADGIEPVTRRAVPFAELLAFYDAAAEQLARLNPSPPRRSPRPR